MCLLCRHPSKRLPGEAGGRGHGEGRACQDLLQQGVGCHLRRPLDPGGGGRGVPGAGFPGGRARHL